MTAATQPDTLDALDWDHTPKCESRYGCGQIAKWAGFANCRCNPPAYLCQPHKERDERKIAEHVTRCVTCRKQVTVQWERI